MARKVSKVVVAEKKQARGMGRQAMMMAPEEMPMKPMMKPKEMPKAQAMMMSKGKMPKMMGKGH